MSYFYCIKCSGTFDPAFTYCPVCEDVSLIEQLQAKVAELEAEVERLTRQRDLAVEVLKTAYEVATNHDDRLPFDWAVYCEMLWQAIKESDGK